MEKNQPWKQRAGLMLLTIKALWSKSRTKQEICLQVDLLYFKYTVRLIICEASVILLLGEVIDLSFSVLVVSSRGFLSWPAEYKLISFRYMHSAIASKIYVLNPIR